MARIIWEFGDLFVWNGVKYGFVYKVENEKVRVASVIATDRNGSDSIVLLELDENDDKLQREFEFLKDFDDVPEKLKLPIKFARYVAASLNEG